MGVPREHLPSTPANCVICLEEQDNNTIKLRCNHLFHQACIETWFKNAPTCPSCRFVATNKTPRPPEMTPEEVLAVPDYEPPRLLPGQDPFELLASRLSR